MYCVVLIASLCFEGHHLKMTMDNEVMGYSASVTAEQYRVVTGVTDEIDMHDFRKSPQACADDRCIRYHKHCARSGVRVTCTYRLVWPGIAPDGRVMIFADNENALTTAEREVSLIFERDGRKVKLPFSTMSARDSAEMPPDCPLGTAFSVCDPP